MSYEYRLSMLRFFREKYKNCPFKVLQPYDKGEGYYGCSKDGKIGSCYPNYNFQCNPKY